MKCNRCRVEIGDENSFLSLTIEAWWYKNTGAQETEMENGYPFCVSCGKDVVKAIREALKPV